MKLSWSFACPSPFPGTQLQVHALMVFFFYVEEGMQVARLVWFLKLSCHGWLWYTWIHLFFALFSFIGCTILYISSSFNVSICSFFMGLLHYTITPKWDLSPKFGLFKRRGSMGFFFFFYACFFMYVDVHSFCWLCYYFCYQRWGVMCPAYGFFQCFSLKYLSFLALWLGGSSVGITGWWA